MTGPPAGLFLQTHALDHHAAAGPRVAAVEHPRVGAVAAHGVRGPGLVQLGAGPVYLTFDIDGIDPAFAPGVAHREAGAAALTALADDDAARDAIRERTIDTISRYAPGLREQILGAEFLTPADLEARYRVTGGHWHHTEFAMDQMLMMRPTYEAAQYRTPIPRLWLCGAGSHPAGDLTGLAGHNAAHQGRIDLDAARRREDLGGGDPATRGESASSRVSTTGVGTPANGSPTATCNAAELKQPRSCSTPCGATTARANPNGCATT